MGAASRPTSMTGAAGVHLLTGMLSAMNLPVGISQKNVPNVDLFVGSNLGTAVAIQVKTMRSAQRKGFYEWRCSPTRLKSGFYAFIDLRQKRDQPRLSKLPDVFVVPVEVVKKWKHYPPKKSFVKPKTVDLSKYKNNAGWDLLLRELGYIAKSEA